MRPITTFRLALYLFLGLQPLLAQGVERGGDVPAPHLTGFLLDHEWDADGDGDGIKETHMKLYRDATGDTIFSASTMGVIWAWSLNTHGDDDSERASNFVIRDSNCDGSFDEVYSLDEKFTVPACLEQSVPKRAAP